MLTIVGKKKFVFLTLLFKKSNFFKLKRRKYPHFKPVHYHKSEIWWYSYRGSFKLFETKYGNATKSLKISNPKSLGKPNK